MKVATTLSINMLFYDNVYKGNITEIKTCYFSLVLNNETKLIRNGNSVFLKKKKKTGSETINISNGTSHTLCWDFIVCVYIQSVVSSHLLCRIA